jgi:hypothetical protein
MRQVHFQHPIIAFDVCKEEHYVCVNGERGGDRRGEGNNKHIARRISMKIIASSLLALSILAGGAVSASAANNDCKATRWTNGQQSGPVFACPDSAK